MKSGLNEAESIQSTILLIEDSPSTTKVIQTFLTDAGHQVVSAATGNEGISQALASRPDLILLDIVLPDTDGIELCKKIREHPDFSLTPVIFITSLQDTESTVKGLDAGGNDYVRKPFSSQELLARVNTHLSSARYWKSVHETNHALTKSLEEKKAYFKLIAHDVRSPLYSVLSLSKMFAENPDSFSKEEIVEVAGQIYQSLTGVSLLLEDLLTWERMSEQQKQLSPFQIKDLIQTILLTLDEKLKSKNITLTIDADEKMQIVSDAGLCTSIVRNLIDNSIKFSERNHEILLKIENENDCIRIEVADQGVGIPEQQKQKLFLPGTGKGSKGTEGEAGSGFGLPIVAEAVRILGGSIDVKSSPEEGTTFTIYL